MTRFILILSLTLTLTGCISRKASRGIDTAVTTVAAGAAGYYASDGDAGIAAGAATAAFAAKKYAAHVEDEHQREEVEQAFAAGEAKATRDLYEAIQRNQSVDTAQDTTDEAQGGTYLPVAAPRRVVNGVIVEPTIEYIRINDLPEQ